MSDKFRKHTIESDELTAAQLATVDQNLAIIRTLMVELVTAAVVHMKQVPDCPSPCIGEVATKAIIDLSAKQQQMVLVMAVRMLAKAYQEQGNGPVD